MPVEKEVLSDLKKISGLWKKTKPQTGFAQLEDNDYIAKLVRMAVNKSKGGTGRLQVQTTFKIMDGDSKGKETSRFDGLDEKGMPYLKGMCEVMGCELPDDISELPSALEEFVDGCDDLFNIQLKTKNEYQNLYVKGVSEYTIDGEDDTDGGDGDGTEEDTGEEGGEEGGDEPTEEELAELEAEEEAEREREAERKRKIMLKRKKEKEAASSKKKPAGKR